MPVDLLLKGTYQLFKLRSNGVRQAREVSLATPLDAEGAATLRTQLMVAQCMGKATSHKRVSSSQYSRGAVNCFACLVVRCHTKIGTAPTSSCNGHELAYHC